MIKGRKKFLLDYGGIALSQFIVALRPLILIAVIMPQFGNEGYGIWTQLIITSTFISVLISLRLSMVLTRFLSGTEDKRYLSGAIIASLMATVIVGVLTIFGSSLATNKLSVLLFGESGHNAFALLTMAHGTSSACFGVAISYFLIIERQRMHGFIKALAQIGEALVVVSMAWWLDLESIIMLCIVWKLLVTLSVIIYMCLECGIARPRLPVNREFISFGGWLMLSQITFFGATHASRYVLVNFVGVEQLAVFAAAYSVAKVIELVIMPVRFALLPTISAHWNRQEYDKTKPLISLCYKLLFLLGLPMLGGLYMYGNVLIGLLSSNQVNIKPWIILLLGIAPLMNGLRTINSTAFWMKKNIHYSLGIQLMGMAINLLLTIILVRSFGVIGAVIAAVCSMLSMAMLSHQYAIKVFKVKINWYHFAKSVFCAGLMMGGLILWSFVDIGQILAMIIGVFLGLIIYAIFALITGAVPIDQMLEAIGLAKSGIMKKRTKRQKMK